MAYAILIIEDEVVLAKQIKRYLTRFDYDVRVVENGQDGIEAFETFKPDVVLLDFNLPGGLNGLDVLRHITATDSGTKIIMLTGHGSEQIAVDAMKAGAHDYLSKPVVLKELKLIIDQAVGLDRLEGTLSYYHEKEASKSGLDNIIGNSPIIIQLKDRLTRLLDAERQMTDDQAPAVLITGETGTGKELIARALHFDSSRHSKPFVEINAATISPDLIESELFGHERGAFTDARERKLGLVESAHLGTLFLDEIGEVTPAVQVKMLKLLEDKMVRRVGGVRNHKVNIRIIAATNQSLEALVREGQFRSDLYYRLRVVTFESPPLRSRGNDVLLLADFFLAFHRKRYRKPHLQFDREVMETFLHYHWPGNIRELRNVIEQAVLLTQADTIGVEQFAFAAFTNDTSSIEAPNSLKTTNGKLKDVERELIIQALNDAAWNVTQAANSLGLTRDQLRYRMEKYAMQRDTQHLNRISDPGR